MYLGTFFPHIIYWKKSLYVLLFSLDNYDQEGYNPESPGLTAAGRNQYRQFIPRVQTQRSNLIGLTSNEGQGSRGNRYLSS